MIRSTTVICVRHKGKNAMAADGQVTMGQTILKEKAQRSGAWPRRCPSRVRRGHVGRLRPVRPASRRSSRSTGGNLARAAIELAKDWRMEKSLRQLDALLIVANKETALLHLRDR